MTEKQVEIWVPHYAQYVSDWNDLQERRVRVDREFKDLVSELIEANAEDGDQERIINLYKAEGYPMSRKVITDIHLAFRMAGAMKSGKTTQGRKKAIRKLVIGQKGYGKKAMQKLSAVEEEVGKERMLAAKQLLLSDIIKTHWKPIGQILRDNYDVLSWPDVHASLAKYEQGWHEVFDKIIAEDQAVDSQVKKAKGK